ncbi:unnamed protein product [Bursaphelenchus okinawaensis]|uniref:Carboxylesterase type B domain-containing protein n=1 Tax=Bursaphelenchus okinawaensis TaxID=465554 RepID=A0A811LV20_9BILA|nr:unnamed protein product [Bursaphelenchus okinawaensis]CAG9128095.1 unnamed protein product [Bursaphelenchus okinawaensis]
MIMFAFTLRPVASHLEDAQSHDPQKYVSPTTMLELTNGQIQGYSSDLEDGRTVHSYKGVPYSEPPEDIYRFEKPTPKAEWDGTLDNTEYGAKCPAWDPVADAFNDGVDDCLHYNVFAHSECMQEPCPVIVLLLPDALSKEDEIKNKYLLQKLVVVTVGFRTGILGFLNLGVSKEDAPLNAGFYDIQLALRIIHEEISKFGGDAEKITVISEVSNIVEYLMASDSKYFSKAVTVTSSAPRLNSMVNSEETQKVVTELGCTNDDIEGSSNCLRKAKLEDLIKPESVVLAPESDATALPFSNLEAMAGLWKEMPLVFINKLPETTPFALDAMCKMYSPLFSFKQSVEDCEASYDDKMVLLKDVMTAYGLKIREMNNNNGVFVELSADADLADVYIKFATEESDNAATQEALLAAGAQVLESSEGAEKWLQSPAERLSKRHLLLKQAHRHRRYVNPQSNEQMALYLCMTVVFLLVTVVAVLAVVFYRRQSRVTVELV